MDQADLKRALQSRQFTFLVGEESTRLSLHIDILRQTSAPLYALASNGAMQESIKGETVLKDVDEGIFLAFANFAYSGDYAVPPREMAMNHEKNDGLQDASWQRGTKMLKSAEPAADGKISIDPSEVACAVEDAVTSGILKPKSIYGRGHGVFLTSMEWVDEDYPGQNDWCGFEISTALAAPIFEQAKLFSNLWDNLHERFNELTLSDKGDSGEYHDTDLLFHAKVYVFSTCYLVDALRDLCLSNLHADLMRLPMEGENVSHFLDLLEYAYVETQRGEPPAEHTLRALVIHFAAVHSRSLPKAGSRFEELLKTYSEIGADLSMVIINADPQ